MLQKNTHKFLIFILLLFYFSSNASDSLKIKKVDYTDGNRLFRTTYYNRSGNITNDFFFDYFEYESGRTLNGCDIYKYKSNKKVAFTKYFFKMEENNIFFYDGPLIGYRWSYEFDTLGKITEQNGEVIYLSDSFFKRTSPLDSLEHFPINTELRFQSRKFYDSLGNLIEEKYIDNPKIIHKNLFKYDSLNRRIEKLMIDDKERLKITYTYFKDYLNVETYVYHKKNLTAHYISKYFENEQKQEIRIEKYQIKGKKLSNKDIPQKVFIQDKKYQDNRLVKIEHSDYITNMTYTYDLKYEFYD